MKYRFLISLLFAILATGLHAQNNIRHNSSNLFSKADAAYKAEDYNKALKLYLDAGSRTDYKKNAAAQKYYIMSQYNAAKCYSKLEHYRQAMETVFPLLSMDTDKKDELNLFYVESALSYAKPMLKSGLDSIYNAREIIQGLIPYAKGDILDKIKSNIQYSYIKESELKSQRMNFTHNIELLQKAYDIYDNEENRLDILYDIASLEDAKGDITKALEYYERARELAVKLSDDKILFNVLNSERNISKTLNDVQRYTSLGASLDSLICKIDDISTKLDHYHNVGNEYLDLRNFNVAEMYFNRIGSELNNLSGPLHFYVALLYYTSMRDLRHAQGDYKLALDYSHKLVESCKEELGENNNMRYLMYLVDAQIYAEMQDSVNFIRVCDTLKTSESFESDVFNKALIYSFRAKGYAKLNDHQKALEDCVKSDSILAQSYDETFNQRMDMLKMRVLELLSLNRIDEARENLDHYKNLVVKVYGKRSKKYSDALAILAELESEAGNPEISAEHYIESIDTLSSILRTQMRYVVSTNRTLYMNEFSNRLWKMSSLALKYSSVNDDFVKVCYNTILKLKSLLFQSDMSMYNTLKLKGSKEDVDDFVRLSFLRNKHKRLLKDSEKNKDEIDANHLEIRKLDNKLTNKSKLYKEYTSFLDFDFDDLREMLGKNDVLFDFFDYQEKGVGRVYVAYVVEKNSKYPKILKMFTEADLKKELEGLTIETLYNNCNYAKVNKLFWKKLKRYAKRGGNVYYVPSGWLTLMALESIPMKNGSLLGEHYNFIRLTSARVLSNSDDKIPASAKAVLYGGLNYDMKEEEMDEQKTKYQSLYSYLKRGASLENSKFSYLPSTLDEINQISNILRAKGIQTTCFTGNEGTEESFLSMHNNSPEILHIATHAFYYTPEEAQNISFLKGQTDAMLLSGLIMSGGNSKLTREESVNDFLGGVLTSENISCIDLSNINLAVLSACKTAKGKITKEGIYGLQRAFKKAGARTIVMSLWEVSDVVTREFMVEFYNNLFENNSFDKRKAFEKAKLHIRNKYPEPFYWAGFVMVD